MPSLSISNTREIAEALSSARLLTSWPISIQLQAHMERPYAGLGPANSLAVLGHRLPTTLTHLCLHRPWLRPEHKQKPPDTGFSPLVLQHEDWGTRPRLRPERRTRVLYPAELHFSCQNKCARHLSKAFDSPIAIGENAHFYSIRIVMLIFWL